MKKRLSILAAIAVTAAMMVAAGPASADHLDEDEVLFWGYPGYYYVVDDVDYKNVRERSPKDGQCFVTDVDRDGLLSEYDYACYY